MIINGKSFKWITVLFACLFFCFLGLSFSSDNEIESLILKSFPVEINPKEQVSKVLKGNAMPLKLNDQVPFYGIPHKFVNTTTGNLTFKFLDLYLPGYMPIEMGRVYDSSINEFLPPPPPGQPQEPRCYHDLGKNWVLGYSAYIGTIMYEDYSQGIFLATEEGSIIFFNQIEPGVYEKRTDFPSDHMRIWTLDANTLVEDMPNGIRREFTAGVGFAHWSLTKVVDKNGNYIVVSYQDGYIKKIENNSSHWIEIERPMWKNPPESPPYPDWRITKLTDSIGRSVEFDYDASGLLTSATNVAEYTYQFQYDPNNEKLTSVTDPLANQILSVTYDTENRVETYSMGSYSATFSYFPGERTDVAESGVVLPYRYFYNDDGITEKIIDPENYTNWIFLDSANNISMFKDARENFFNFTYDSEHRLLTFSPPGSSQGSLIYTYDPNTGYLTSVQDFKGNTTTFAYDANGNVTSETDEAGNMTTATYGPNGQVLTLTNPRTHTYHFSYDGYGNKTSITDPTNRIIEMAYSPSGKLIEINKPYDETTDSIYTFSYNSLDLLSSVQDPLGNTKNFAYNNVGLITGITDEAGYSITFNYDSNYQITTVTDQLGNITNYEYDNRRNLISKTDPKLNEWSYTYDSLDRLIQETDPLERTWSYDYDENGNLRYKTFPNNQHISFTYDERNRLTQRDYPGDFDEYIYYDANSNITRLKRVEGTITDQIDYQYDVLNRITSMTVEYGATGLIKNFSFTFDANGNIASMVPPDGNEGTFSYVYDELDRLIEINNNGNGSDFGYDQFSGLRKLIKFSNLYKTAYYYDLAGMINGYDIIDCDDQVLESYSIDRDSRGLPTAITEIIEGAEFYNYDKRGATKQFIGRDDFITDFVYDELGNVIESTTEDTEGNISNNRYSYNAANEIQWIDEDTDNISYTYEHLGDTDYAFRILKSPSSENSVPQYIYFGYDGRVNKLEKSDGETFREFKKFSWFPHDLNFIMHEIDIDVDGTLHQNDYVFPLLAPWAKYDEIGAKLFAYPQEYSMDELAKSDFLSSQKSRNVLDLEFYQKFSRQHHLDIKNSISETVNMAFSGIKASSFSSLTQFMENILWKKTIPPYYQNMDLINDLPHPKYFDDDLHKYIHDAPLIDPENFILSNSEGGGNEETWWQWFATPPTGEDGLTVHECRCAGILGQKGQSNCQYLLCKVGNGEPICTHSGFNRNVSDQEHLRNPDSPDLGVNHSNGEFIYTVKDLDIPGRGLPFVFERTYRSKVRYADGRMGVNWMHNYEEFLGDPPCSDEEIDWFTGTLWGGVFYWDESEGYYESSSGFFGKLFSSPWRIRYPNGLIKYFEEYHHNKYYLTRIEDRNGNSINIHYEEEYDSDGTVEGKRIDYILDTLKRKIDFFYYGDGKLERIEDFSGRNIRYFYNSYGDLERVERIDPSYTYVYTYSSTEEFGGENDERSHNLLTITDPNGNVILQNDYYIDNINRHLTFEHDRVKTQYLDTIEINYVYEQLELQDHNYLTTIKRRMEDGKENITRKYYDELGGNIQELVVETSRDVRLGEGDYTTEFSYGSYYFLNEVLYPEGNRIQYVYDTSNTDWYRRGNLLEIRKIPDSRGAGPDLDGDGTEDYTDIVEIFEYEPIYNQVKTYTNPLGRPTKYIFDYQEGDYSEGDASPLSLYMEEYSIPSSAYSEMEFNKGHVNGDGTTDQIKGNIIKRMEPEVNLANSSYQEQRQQEGGLNPSNIQKIQTFYQYNDFGQLIQFKDAEENVHVRNYFPENKPHDGIEVTPDCTGCDSSTGGYLREELTDTSSVGWRNNGFNYAPINISNSYTYDIVGNVKTITDGRGVETYYQVDQLNRIKEIIRANAVQDPNHTAYQYKEKLFYDNNGNLTREEIQNNNPGESTSFKVNKYAYNVLNQKTSEKIDFGGLNLRTQYDYDNENKLKREVSPEGNVVRYIYDERNLLYKKIHCANKAPDGNADPDIYEPLNADPLPSDDDIETKMDYDANGNLTSSLDPLGYTSQINYDGFDRKIKLIDPAENFSEIFYDRAGNIRKEIFKGPIDGQATVKNTLTKTEYFYDEANRLKNTTRHFNPDGPSLDDCGSCQEAETIFEYDRIGSKTVTSIVKDSEERGEIFKYDGAGRKRERTDPAGNTLIMEYDDSNNLIKKKFTESGGSFSKTFWKSFEYDALDRLEKAIDDPKIEQGNENPNGKNIWTENQFDARDNIIKTERKYYDESEQEVTLSRTDFFYDTVGRLDHKDIEVETNDYILDGLITTSYTYNNNSQSKTITDDKGNTTEYDYDNFGRKKYVKYNKADDMTQLRQITIFEYDKNGNIKFNKIRPDEDSSTEIKIENFYDDMNRRERREISFINLPADHQFGGTTLQEFEYDGLGRITISKDNNDPNNTLDEAQVEYKYDSFGHIISEKQKRNIGGSLQVREVESVYDQTGFRTSLSFPNVQPPDTRRVISYTDDVLNRIENITESSETIVNYSYFGSSKILERAYMNNTKLSFKSLDTTPVLLYDSLGRPKSLLNVDSINNNAHIASYDYGWDNKNDLEYQRHLHEDTADGYYMGRIFTYDKVSRLTGLTEAEIENDDDPAIISTSYYNYEQTFTLDGVDNWAENTIKMKGSSDTTTYENDINNLNQYTAFDGDGSLDYDFAGNLINDENNKYFYDFTNRLIKVEDLSSQIIAEYKYDASNRRVEKIDYTGLSGELVSRYIFDDWRVIEERAYIDPAPGDAYEEVKARFVYGAGLDEVAQMERYEGSNIKHYYYHTDLNNSVAAITDENGAVQERYWYDAFGQVEIWAGQWNPNERSYPTPRGDESDPAIDNKLLFSGQWYDRETGFYYFKNRYYSPKLGRFLQRDPIGYIDSLNLYVYSNNNPVTFRDPLGLASWYDHKYYYPWYLNIKYTSYFFHLIYPDDFAERVADVDKGKTGWWNPFYWDVHFPDLTDIDNLSNAVFDAWLNKNRAKELEYKEQLDHAIKDWNFHAIWKINQQGRCERVRDMGPIEHAFRTIAGKIQYGLTWLFTLGKNPRNTIGPDSNQCPCYPEKLKQSVEMIKESDLALETRKSKHNPNKVANKQSGTGQVSGSQTTSSFRGFVYDGKSSSSSIWVTSLRAQGFGVSVDGISRNDVFTGGRDQGIEDIVKRNPNEKEPF